MASPPGLQTEAGDQQQDEDTSPWTLDLTAYESDIEDSGAALDWSVSGVNTKLFVVEITDLDNDILTITPAARSLEFQ